MRGWHAVCAHASRRRPPLCCSYNKTALKIVGKGGQRWYKNVGLGFRTPKEAIEGERAAAGDGGEGRDGGWQRAQARAAGPPLQPAVSAPACRRAAVAAAAAAVDV